MEVETETGLDQVVEGGVVGDRGNQRQGRPQVWKNDLGV
jgi:hypothetical protein